MHIFETNVFEEIVSYKKTWICCHDRTSTESMSIYLTAVELSSNLISIQGKQITCWEANQAIVIESNWVWCRKSILSTWLDTSIQRTTVKRTHELILMAFQLKFFSYDNITNVVYHTRQKTPSKAVHFFNNHLYPAGGVTRMKSESFQLLHLSALVGKASRVLYFFFVTLTVTRRFTASHSTGSALLSNFVSFWGGGVSSLDELVS